MVLNKLEGTLYEKERKKKLYDIKVSSGSIRTVFINSHYGHLIETQPTRKPVNRHNSRLPFPELLVKPIVRNKSTTQIIKRHPVPLCETSETTPCCMSSVLFCWKTDYSVNSSCFKKNKDNCWFSGSFISLLTQEIRKFPPQIPLQLDITGDESVYRHNRATHYSS